MRKFLNFFQKTRKQAFSLSEITIVLIAIGLVAVLGINTLRLSTKAQFPTMRAVFKNDLATALATMNTEFNLSEFTSTDKFLEVFKKFYNLTNKESDFAAQYKDASGNTVTFKNYDYAFTTQNGTSVKLSFVPGSGEDLATFAAENNQIDFANGSYDFSNATLNYVSGYYDVNGSKGPNKIGEDVGLIMPAYTLKKGQYFSTDTNGNFVVNDKNGTKVAELVDEHNIFNKEAAAKANNKTSKCEGNYLNDDYGDCNICGLTKAACESQGQKLNKASCACEYNVSCPKNQIQDSNGNCVCKAQKPSLPTQGVFAQKEGNTYVWDADACSYRCELGAQLRCLANKGTWKQETCSCSCGSASQTLCSSKSGATGYAAPNANNYCACECNQSLFNSIAHQKENPNNVKDYKYSTEFSANLSDKCFKCATPPDKNTTLVKNDDVNNKDAKYGLCSTNCIMTDYNSWTEANKKFYNPPENTKNLENKAGQCGPTCTLTDATCQSLYNSLVDNNKNNASTFNWLNNCSQNHYNYHTDSKKIKIVADKTNCKCKIGDYNGFVPNNTYGFVCHGYCGYHVGWRCTMTRHGSMKINANNPYPKNQTQISNMYVTQACYNNYDPILLILPYSNNQVVSNIPPMKNGTVSIIPGGGANKATNTTWLAGQAEATASYFFLVKKNNLKYDTTINAENTLFTDMAYNTGIVELEKTYDTNKDGYVNELDGTIGKLALWADYDADAKIKEDEIVKDKQLIEISTITRTVSEITGEAMETDQAVFSIRGNFKAGYPINGNELASGTWVERVADEYAKAHGQIEYIYTEEGQDADGNKVTNTYRYIYESDKYLLIDNYGKIDTSSYNPLAGKTNIRVYKVINGKKYEVKVYELMDILFKEKAN